MIILANQYAHASTMTFEKQTFEVAFVVRNLSIHRENCLPEKQGRHELQYSHRHPITWRSEEKLEATPKNEGALYH